jgi:hypothetical protein
MLIPLIYEIIKGKAFAVLVWQKKWASSKIKSSILCGK